MVDPLMARARLRAAVVSLAVGIVLFGGKLLAWYWTGSAAVLSDALESIVNVVAAALMAYSVWLAGKPADRNHPYGHGKAEDFSAGVEGALIVLAALAIVFHAVRRFADPVPLARIDAGLLLVGGAAATNLVLGLWLLRRGRALRSQALVADGHHVITDVVSSAVAIAGLLLVRITGLAWLDPLAACLIALHIVGSGLRLVRESVGRLMDEADEELLAQMARRLEEVRRDDWIDVHELRAWRSGDYLHVDFHLTLPRYWSVERAHDAQDDVEAALMRGLEEPGEVIIHADPCQPSHCRYCGVEGCPVRSEERSERLEWTRRRVTGEPLDIAQAAGPGSRAGREGDG